MAALILLAVSAVAATLFVAVATGLARRNQAEQSTLRVSEADLQRIAEYAHGARRIVLVSQVCGESDDRWHARVALVELLLDGALLDHGQPAHRARDLRRYAGHQHGRRVQGWELPAPHGAALLERLRTHFAELNTPSYTRIAADM